MKYKVFPSSEGNVWKYVFTKDDMVAEAVLYKYNDFYERTVICCSVMSGCPVGCTFCGTGSKFVRNLKAEEIVQQIELVLSDKKLIDDINEKCHKLQFMFMSMGEPMLNWCEVEKAIIALNSKFSNAQLLLSTIGCDNDDVFNKIISLSKKINKIGLQFSIHKSNDEERNKLIPFEKKMNLEKIRDAGIIWWKETGRHPFLNYCVDGTNNTEIDFKKLTSLFSPVVFNFTFSVVCSSDENMKNAAFRNLTVIKDFQNKFLEKGYNVRMFDPAGQDDIGGGCGQLWYVQNWLKSHNN
jgi:23S rRNA (adenine2503-C2)-methyltransferase